MYSRINYTLVGIFVLLFTLLALAFAFWLAKYGFKERYDSYLLYFNEPVDGLTIDSTVKLNGVDVGKVGTIEIDPQNLRRVRVIIRLKQGTPIVEGMYAVLKFQGITGLSYVQIEGGKMGAPRLSAPAGSLPIIPTQQSFLYRLSQSASEFFEKFQQAAEGLNNFFSRHNQEEFNKILDNTAQATAQAVTMGKRLIALSEEFNRTLAHFDLRSKVLVDSVDRVADTLYKKLPKLLEHVDEAGRSITALSRRIERRFKRGDYNLRKMIRPIQIDLKELSYSYRELAQDLKSLTRHPSSLIFGAGSPPKGPGE